MGQLHVHTCINGGPPLAFLPRLQKHAQSRSSVVETHASLSVFGKVLGGCGIYAGMYGAVAFIISTFGRRAGLRYPVSRAMRYDRRCLIAGMLVVASL